MSALAVAACYKTRAHWKHCARFRIRFTFETLEKSEIRRKNARHGGKEMVSEKGNDANFCCAAGEYLRQSIKGKWNLVKPRESERKIYDRRWSRTFLLVFTMWKIKMNKFDEVRCVASLWVHFMAIIISIYLTLASTQTTRNRVVMNDPFLGRSRQRGRRQFNCSMNKQIQEISQKVVFSSLCAAARRSGGDHRAESNFLVPMSKLLFLLRHPRAIISIEHNEIKQYFSLFATCNAKRFSRSRFRWMTLGFRWMAILSRMKQADKSFPVCQLPVSGHRTTRFIHL